MWHFRSVNYSLSAPRSAIRNYRCVFLSPPPGRKEEFFCLALLKSSVQLKFLFSVLFFFPQDFVLFLQNIGLLRDVLPSIDILTFPGTVVIVLRNTILH